MRTTHTKKIAVALIVSLVVALAVTGVSAAGCQRKVAVKSGTITMCTAGEVISNDVKTIQVPANKASAYRVRTITVTCDKHKELSTLYADAQTALAAGDTKLAATKLAAVLALDPTYRKAKEQSDSIAKGGKPAPDTSPAPSTAPTSPVTPPKPGETDVPVGGLGKWIPDSLTGLVAEKPLTDAVSVTREYTPSAASPAISLVIVAEQFRTAADAKKGWERQVKERYTKDGATLNINGHEMYFGTDGKRFAALGFNDGSVMVAIGLTATKDPKDLRALAEQVAKQLP